MIQNLYLTERILVLKLVLEVTFNKFFIGIYMFLYYFKKFLNVLSVSKNLFICPKNTRAKYRILQIEQDVVLSGNFYFKINIIGKNIFFRVTPNKILENKNFIFGFSSEDVYSIMSFSKHIYQKESKAKIISIDFENNLVKFRRNGEFFVFKIDQICSKKDFLFCLDPSDVFMLGRLVGSNDSLIF